MPISEGEFRGLSNKVVEVDERSKSNTKRIDELCNDMKDIKADQKALMVMAQGIEAISKDVKYIQSDITEVKDTQKESTQEIKKTQKAITDRVDALEKAPLEAVNNRTKFVLEKGAIIVLGGVIGYLLNAIFPTISW